MPWFCKKCALILERCALFVSIYGLNSHLKCSFKSILEINTKMFPCGSFLLCVVHETFIEVSLFQEISPAAKHFWLCSLYLCPLLSAKVAHFWNTVFPNLFGCFSCCICLDSFYYCFIFSKDMCITVITMALLKHCCFDFI